MPQMPKIATWHLPVPDVESATYWQGAREGKLLIKHCNACERHFFYPRAACPFCWSVDTSWRESSGRGNVYTFTVVHQNDLPPFRDRVPYVIAVIELEEGVRMTANVEGCSPDDVRCGMRVRVAFRDEARSEDDVVSLPVFRPEG
ncbi:MAG: Zn-ribbon domain-containing OB-fold protein [Actinomycetota bacterium]|nr:Zn-ribbon domain-containing OB-fold protein [Actinomycetota bacterium]